MIVACPDCGTIQRTPSLARHERSLCVRCEKVLERTTGRSVDFALALSVATLLLLVPANTTRLMTLPFGGIERTSRLGSGIFVMWREGWPLLAIGVALQGVILPFFRFGMLSACLVAIRLGRQGHWTGPVFRWAERFDLWAMPDVFLLGAIVGYSRVAVHLPVEIGPGGWCLIAAAFLTMLTRATLDRRALWRLIGDPGGPVEGPRIACTACDLVRPATWEGKRCPRCALRLSRRKPASLQLTTALVIAGFPLFILSNWFPITIQSQLGNTTNQTIIWGVSQLVDANLYPLAVLIFTASIMIPLVKLTVLGWLVWSIHHHSAARLVLKTRLFRFVEEIGRWSNMDIFTVTIFLPIFHIGNFLDVRIGGGAPAFLAVIVITMFAAKFFDPRLLWDQASGSMARARSTRVVGMPVRTPSPFRSTRRASSGI